MRTKIAVLLPHGDARTYFITDGVLKRLGEIGEVRVNERDYSADVMKEMLKDADICLTGWGCPALTKDILDGAPEIKLVVHTGGTVAALVSDELYLRGIKVISANALYAESVAEGALAYMLTGLRRIPYFAQKVQEGVWRKDPYQNKGLLNRKVGLLGFGAIARELVPLLKAFKCEIMVCDPKLTREECEKQGLIYADSIETLFLNSEVVSLHVPLTDDTYHIVNKRILSLLPDGALLVNTARGSVVDEAALTEELKTGRVGAVLDVFEKEPLPMDSPLYGLPNAVLLPHIAGPTTERLEGVTFFLIEDIMRFLKGEPLKYEISKEYAAAMTRERGG
jgi:Phosphoglycerate dehydrogenase and related dehydrogenases